MATAIEFHRRSKRALLDELAEAGADVQRPNAIRCPFHDDRHPSAGVYQDADGVWRFKCHTSGCGFCGDLFDVRSRRTGKPLASLLAAERPPVARFSPPSGPRVHPTLRSLAASLPGDCEGVYVYDRPDSARAELVVLRYRDAGGKGFRQGHELPGGGYVLQAPPKPWPVYNRRGIAASDPARPVVVVEGEKCARALIHLGVCATTSPGGAGKAEHADWSPLAGRRVVLWPDHDDPGVNHMRRVAELLERLNPSPAVSWLEPEHVGLGPKQDAADWVAEHPEAAEFIGPLLDSATPMDAASDVDGRISRIIRGQMRCVPWPWPQVDDLTKALMPQTVTVLCGDPGASKSFLLLEAVTHWVGEGVRVAVYELEEDRGYHLQRVLAQLSGNASLTDPRWIEQNPRDTEGELDRHRSTLDAVGRCIHDAPDDHPTLDEVAAWVESQAESGARVICVDPITAAQASDKPWVSDQRFMMRVKSAVRRSGASLVLVTHPKMGAKGHITLETIAGGAAWPRFSQTVLVLEHHYPPRDRTVKDCYGLTRDVESNRSLRIAKARNARGAGMTIAMNLDTETLRFRCEGVVTG